MTSQLAFDFKGKTFDFARDGERLGKQLRAVVGVMERRRGDWLTFKEIAGGCDAWFGVNAPDASISARLRDMRKLGYEVERRYVCNGLHEYRIV